MSNSANGSFPWTQKTQTSSESVHLVDILRPVSSFVWFSEFLSWGLNSYAPLMCVFGLVAFLKTYFDKLQSLIEHHFTATLHVKATDETFDMLMAWVLSRKVDKAARSIIARADGKSRRGANKVDKKSICFSPWIGSFSFPFKHKTLSFEMQTVDRGLHKEEVISISCPGRSVQILKDFIGECRHEYLRQIGSKITIFRNSGDYWKRISTKEKRPLATVITKGSLKQELVDDLENFLNEETHHWYTQRSIPYRRGYLLHGPPGTGKSSLGSAVAGEFDLDIYIISAPTVDDQTLEELFNSLPERCAVLLEDIDAIETDRRGSDETGKKTLSLSGLLNTLDGVASQEGRILIMTTNHIENLDEALIRPGRIDMKLEIPLADSEVTKDLFSFVFTPDTGHDAVDNEVVLEVSRLAGNFAQKVPELKFSTAQIMSYLLKHKNSAKDALKEANDWFGVVPNNKRAKTGEGKCYGPTEAPQHAEDGLWMEKGKGEKPTDRIKRTKKFPDLKLIIPTSPPPSCCASTPPLSAVGKSVVRTTPAPPDAGAETEPDIVDQVHGSKNDCNYNAQTRDSDVDIPLDYGARKTTEDDCRGLGTQGWRKEQPADDNFSRSVIGDRWLETNQQHGNGAFHPVGMLKNAIIVTTSIEQTTSPSSGSIATSKVETNIKAMHPVTSHHGTSAPQSLNLVPLDPIFAFDAVKDPSGRVNGVQTDIKATHPDCRCAHSSALPPFDLGSSHSQSETRLPDAAQLQELLPVSAGSEDHKVQSPLLTDAGLQIASRASAPLRMVKAAICSPNCCQENTGDLTMTAEDWQKFGTHKGMDINEVLSRFDDARAKMSPDSVKDDGVNTPSIDAPRPTLIDFHNRDEKHEETNVMYGLPTEIKSADDVIQPDEEFSGASTVQASGLFPSSSSTASKSYTPLAAKLDFQVELASGARNARDKSSTNASTQFRDHDIGSPVNYGSRKMTAEDFDKLGLQDLWKRDLSEANTGLPPFTSEGFHELGDARRDSLSSTGGATVDSDPASALPAHTRFPGAETESSISTGFGRQTEMLDVVAIHGQGRGTTDDGLADESGWVKVETGTDNLPTHVEMSGE